MYFTVYSRCLCTAIKWTFCISAICPPSFAAGLIDRHVKCKLNTKPCPHHPLSSPSLRQIDAYRRRAQHNSHRICIVRVQCELMYRPDKVMLLMILIIHGIYRKFGRELPSKHPNRKNCGRARSIANVGIHRNVNPIKFSCTVQRTIRYTACMISHFALLPDRSSTACFCLARHCCGTVFGQHMYFTSCVHKMRRGG